MSLSGHERYTDTARLVTQAQHGDHEAFRQLFDAYAPFVYRVAYRMLGQADEAADLAQEVCIRAYERLPSLRDPQAFHAWLGRLALHMAHDAVRRRRAARPPRTITFDELEPRQIPDPSRPHVDRLLSEELSRRVQDALARLSLDHRAVIVLHHLEGLEVEMIARVLAIPQGTVKSRLARARAALRGLLAEYIEG